MIIMIIMLMVVVFYHWAQLAERNDSFLSLVAWAFNQYALFDPGKVHCHLYSHALTDLRLLLDAFFLRPLVHQERGRKRIYCSLSLHVTSSA
jgi:hypothetical protein